MPVPRVAIVGRPNVGKSSLLNLIAADKVAIVDPTPGVTRDRVSIVRDLDSPDGSGPPKPVEFTDTGGYGVYTAPDGRYDEVGNDLHELTKDIEQQIAHAVETADIVLFCVDAQAGVTSADEEIARLLRTRGLSEDTPGKSASDSSRAGRIVPVATKVDGPKWEAHAYELSGLGFGEPLMLSSKSNYFRRDFLDAIYNMLPEPDEHREPDCDLRVAILGKRNAGKSSLINALAGAPRVIVSEIAGTTRDAVDVKFELDDRSIVAIDTAGVRKKKSFQGPIEWYAFDRAKRAVTRCDVVIFMIDATTSISQVDQQIAMLCQKAHKPVVLVVNKWDLAKGRPNAKGRPVTPEDYEKYLRKEVMGLRFAPIVFASATEGLNLRGILDVAFDIYEQAGTRVGTGQLNRLVRSLIDMRGPSDKLGTACRLYYAAQVRTHPPTIALVVNHADLFTDNYEKFLLNRFREELPYHEVPIRLVVRERSKRHKDRTYSTEHEAAIEALEAGLDPESLSLDEQLARDATDADDFFDD
ncbi:MAG: ribosome biogenesis GTPase Der [Planctomycetota bacterium]